MRVLHVIPSISERSGGPAQAIFPMCRALQEQGTETVIVSTNHGLNATAEHEGVIHGVKTHLFSSQLGESFKYSRPLTKWLNKNVADFDVVHIHAVFNHACFAAARACARKSVPYIVRPLGTLSPWGMNQKSLKKTLFWKFLGKEMLLCSAAVHYTATAEKNATENLLGLNHGCVIPLGVSVNAAGNDSSLRTETSNLHPYVLVLSRLHSKKGLDIFIEAFLSVVARPEFSKWRLVLAGEGPDDYVKRLRDLVRSHHAEQSVQFTGWLDGEKKNAYLRGAELLSLPSYYENFGLCVVEAMACGVPVLVSPHVDIAEDIRRADAGWIANVDQESIEKALVEALSSADERTRRGKSGEELASTFTWSTVATRLNELYARVTAS